MIKFKGKDFKAVNQEMKYWMFSFNILPTKITAENVKIKGIKRIKDNAIRFSKAEFLRPAPGNDSIKPLKMKYSKKEGKADYYAYYGTPTTNDYSKITISGRNNYYGKAILTVQE